MSFLYGIWAICVWNNVEYIESKGRSTRYDCHMQPSLLGQLFKVGWMSTNPYFKTSEIETTIDSDKICEEILPSLQSC